MLQPARNHQTRSNATKSSSAPTDVPSRAIVTATPNDPPNCWTAWVAAPPTPTRFLGSAWAAALEAYHQTYIQPCEGYCEHAATLREALEGAFAAAIDDGELDPTAEATVIVGFVLSQFSALSAVSRSNPTRPELGSMVGFMLGGLPWAERV